MNIEGTNCESCQSSIGFPRTGLSKAAMPFKSLCKGFSFTFLPVSGLISPISSCSVNSADIQREDNQTISWMPPLYFPLTASLPCSWKLPIAVKFVWKCFFVSCVLTPLAAVNCRCIFSRSLILSLEAKLNVLHNYMNVTWIRIPSETRVTSSHTCALFVIVDLALQRLLCSRSILNHHCHQSVPFTVKTQQSQASMSHYDSSVK